jgi:hypothetical protein
MTWRQILGFIDESALDLSAVQTRYQKLRTEREYEVCERRRLKQAVEAARRELTQRLKGEKLAARYRLGDVSVRTSRKTSR